MKLSPAATFVAGAAVALVIGSGTAYAATGGSFILGHSNTTKTTTTLSDTGGTALSLQSKAGTPPLKVNRNVKVANLNADLLDGRDSTYFALAGGQVGTIEGDGELVDTDGDGTVDTIIAVATCPQGTQMTGGGGVDGTGDGVLFGNAPIGPNQWAVASTSPTLTAENATNVTAYAQCWNPRGTVAGALARPAATSKAGSFEERLEAFAQRPSTR